jgi:hypothetical protein
MTIRPTTDRLKESLWTSQLNSPPDSVDGIATDGHLWSARKGAISREKSANVKRREKPQLTQI